MEDTTEETTNDTIIYIEETTEETTEKSTNCYQIISDCQSGFYNLIKQMVENENYIKIFKQHKKSGPESLKGTYTPIYAGIVLRTFFEANTGFGPLDPILWKTTGVMNELLMDKLPYAKQGFMLRNTLTMLFFLYVRTMELQELENPQFIHFDDVMKKVFTEMDAAFYTAEGVPKMEMNDAINKGLIKAPLSTQDVIRLKRPEFNGDKTPINKDIYEDKQIYRKAFQTYYFQLLASNNYYSKENLKENNEYAHILETIEKKEVTDQMILEHNIVKETSIKWNEYLEPFRKANRDKRRKEREVINDTVNQSELRKRF